MSKNSSNRIGTMSKRRTKAVVVKRRNSQDQVVEIPIADLPKNWIISEEMERSLSLPATVPSEESSTVGYDIGEDDVPGERLWARAIREWQSGQPGRVVELITSLPIPPFAREFLQVLAYGKVKNLNEGRPFHPQNLCADAGFSGLPAHGQMVERGYHPHVRPRGEEKVRRKNGYKPRRWIVEVAHSWFNRFRKLLVRYEKTHRSYLALNMLAAAIICFRKVPGEMNIIHG